MAEGERERSQPPVLRATSFQRKEGKAVKNHLPPSQGRGMPEGQGVGRRRKSAKPTSGAARHLLPEEGGRVVRNLSPFLWKGEAVKNHLPPSRGRGMPEGQGVGRRRKRAKPTSGATRHLFPEEGGRRGESHLPPSCGRGMPEGQGVGRRRKNEANLRRSAPPPPKGRREKW